jgi:hypothetical protein
MEAAIVPVTKSLTGISHPGDTKRKKFGMVE